jgi:monoamine oxidase
VIKELPYTSVVRVFVQLRERFWLARKEAGDVTTGLPIQEIYDDTGTQGGNRGILSSYSARARKMAG